MALFLYMQKYIAIDFETYYDTKYSIKHYGNRAFCEHPEFDAYLVAIYGDDYEFVGHPIDVDWNILNDKIAIAHNAGFDKAILDKLRASEKYPIPEIDFVCTADLSVYLGAGRKLDEAVKNLLGLTISKEVRKNMNGKTIDDLKDWDETKLATNKAERKKKSDYEALLKYALDDAKYCYEIWTKYSDQWPQVERALAKHTRGMAEYGVQIDTEKLDKYLKRANEMWSS